MPLSLGVLLLSSQQYLDMDMINDSWKRCYELGFQPTDDVYDALLTDQQIDDLLQENQGLIQHTVPVFEKLFSLFRQADYIAAFVDRNGTIVHTAANSAFELEARKIQMLIGANWQEHRRGTNAMGVALVEQKPVRIHGDHHFYVENRFLTCAACPIFTPTGELAGAINISGRIEQFNPSILALTSFIADSLQNRLLLEQAKQEHLLTLRALEHTENANLTPLISLDKEHRIMRANHAAQRILGKDCLGKEFRHKDGFVVETIFNNTQKLWQSVAIQRNEKKKSPLYLFQDIAGTCSRIVQVKELAHRAAGTDFPILLTGESGTGKELFAQSIHMASSRVDQPFIAVNCSAIPEELVESELFGYERGAFTGANREGSQGKFEAAHRGSLFLDEIGDMSLRAQAVLLRVLQEKVITPVGSVKSKSVDVRIIAATHKNLMEEIKAKRFREDLYYRLKGLQIILPALRDRSDLVELAEQLLRKQYYPAIKLSKDAQQKLLRHNWPGNVRELNSVLMEAAFLSDGAQITAEHLQFENPYVDEPSFHSERVNSLMDAEKETILRTLHVTDWNISKAAKLLQIGRNTLYRKIDEYHISKQKT